MARVAITREDFLGDRQGRTFSDVANDFEVGFQTVLDFFSDEGRQRRMQEAEIHHDRPPLAGAIRELEADPSIDEFLASSSPSRAKRLRQAVGVVVRMVMERLDWVKTGKKGCLGVRAPTDHQKVRAGQQAAAVGACHNTGGLAFWFLRAERYARRDGMPFLSVKNRARRLLASPSPQSLTEGEAAT